MTVLKHFPLCCGSIGVIEKHYIIIVRPVHPQVI